MEPTLRLTQVLKEKAEDIGLQAKDIAEYVTRQQTLDREERAVWREAQKRQVEIWVAELQAEDKKRADELQAEDKKRADEIHMAERADEIKIQIAQIEAAKEEPRWIKNSRLKRWSYKLNKFKLLPVLQPLHPLAIKMPSPQSYHPL